MKKITLAALQLGYDQRGTAATLEKILGYESAIREAGAELVVMPEAILGGYPKGADFGTRVGYRLDAGREAFRHYHEQAVDLDGPEVAALEGLAKRTGATLVVGAIERAGATLYCTALYITPEGGLVAKHRKLMSTAAERLIWGQGDGSTMPVVETPLGRAGAAICWENYMPFYRAALYAQGVELWCAPTVDDRDVWHSSMRHIATEGRCFLVSACQVMPSPEQLGVEAPGRAAHEPLIRGGSVIVSPLGQVLAGPLYGDEGLVVATVDRDDIVRARYDFDVTGHYARPDVFELAVDTRAKPGVALRAGGAQCTPAAPDKAEG